MVGLIAHIVRTPPSVLFGRDWPGVDPRERFACFSHLIGAVAALIGGSALVGLAPTLGLRVVSLFYAVGAVAMLSASTLYHAQKRENDGTGVWRRVDHVAVFFMIAGTFTPLCYAHLSPVWFWSLVGAQWLVAISGTVFKIVVVDTHRWLTTGIYLGMGWMAAIPLPQLADTMGRWQLAALIGGGLAYTVGAVVYGLKRPDPWSDVFGFHGIFHLFVLAGAVLHYLVVFESVVG